MAENNKKIVNEFLRNLPSSKDVSETIKYGTSKYFISLANITILTNMASFYDFDKILKYEFYIFNKEQKTTKTVHLYGDKNEIIKDELDEIMHKSTNLADVIVITSIREKTKNIARKCVEEKLKEYSQDDGSALAEFEEIFVEEVRRR